MPKPVQNEPRSTDLLEWAVGEFRRYMHAPDPGFLFVTLGSVVANCFEGDPVWLMLVGPSGCGKSTTLLTVAQARPAWFRVVSEASRAAFLSGTSRRDRASDATGGLLCEIAQNDVHFLVFKEYGSILDQKKEEYTQISAMQREIWDGQIYRPVGSDGGRVLNWRGKVGELAACTNRIDEILEDEVTRGVRWLLWRYPPSTGWHEGMMASCARDTDERNDCLNSAVVAVLEAANLHWGMPMRALTDREVVRINRLAAISSKLQGAIHRDRFRRDIIASPNAAYPTRLAPALTRIYLGMERLGVVESFRWQQIRKIAFDSAPALRVHVLSEFIQRAGNGRARDWLEMSESVRCGHAAMLRQMEDLALLGVFERQRVSGGWRYHVAHSTLEELSDY